MSLLNREGRDGGEGREVGEGSEGREGGVIARVERVA